MYARLAVVGELASDNAHVHWILVLMFLHLPLAIWLFLVLDCLPVFDCGLSLL